MTPPLQVVCAVITNASNQILACQRNTGTVLAGKWEFPGGKVETGETLKVALIREIEEELGVTIRVGSPLDTVMHQYPDLMIDLHPFYCHITDLQIPLALDHAQIRWVSLDDSLCLNSANWAEADRKILAQIFQDMKSNRT